MVQYHSTRNQAIYIKYSVNSYLQHAFCMGLQETFSSIINPLQTGVFIYIVLFHLYDGHFCSSTLIDQSNSNTLVFKILHNLKLEICVLNTKWSNSFLRQGTSLQYMTVSDCLHVNKLYGPSTSNCK